MKLGRLLLATLAYSLQNKPAAATSGRRLQSSAACSDEDSFYFDTTYTFDDATLSGCYAVESTGAEANDVHVFTVNGGEQAEGDLVFFATSSLSDDNLVSYETTNRLCELSPLSNVVLVFLPSILSLLITIRVVPAGLTNFQSRGIPIPIYQIFWLCCMCLGDRRGRLPCSWEIRDVFCTCVANPHARVCGAST